MLEQLGVRWICVTAGSPYYNPHMQRPAVFPPLDGYQPPEDPLRGVARQIQATALLKQRFPNLVFVGSAYSYLQEWLPHVGAARRARRAVPTSSASAASSLSYPDLPADVLGGAPLRAQVRSAARSATAPPARGSGWCPAAIRWTRSTSRGPRRSDSRRADGNQSRRNWLTRRRA